MAQKKGSNAKSGTNRKKSEVSVVAVVIAALLLYVVCNFVYGQLTKIETETAQKVTISDTISTQGIAIRNETVIKSDYSGVTVSVVENGGRVYKGETIVNVFSSDSSAQAYLRVREIDEALEEFESMKTAGAENATEIGSVDKMINNRLLSLSSSVYNGDIEDALELSEELLYVLNKNQIATKQVENFDARVNELKAERDSLLAKYSDAPTALKSPLAGYYISEADGYEDLLNTDVIEGLTPEKLEDIINSRVQITDPSVIGKIADNYKWHLVCTVTAEEASRLSENKFYTIMLPYSETESIEAKLITITPNADETEYLLTFRCSYMVSDLASFRSQPIIIQVKNFTGLGINQAAIVYKEEVREVSSSDGLITTQTEAIPGVYILWGNEVRFRQINEIYRDGDTVVCSIESARGWLKMYDDVIINKENMYDGKIVNIS